MRTLRPAHCVQRQGQTLHVLTQKKVSLSSVDLINVLGLWWSRLKSHLWNEAMCVWLCVRSIRSWAHLQLLKEQYLALQILSIISGSYCLPKPTCDTTEEIKIERREIIFSVSYRKCAGIGAHLPWVLLLFLDQKIALPLHRHPVCVSADPLLCGAPFVLDLNLTLFHTHLGFSCCCYNKL